MSCSGPNAFLQSGYSDFKGLVWKGIINTIGYWDSMSEHGENIHLLIFPSFGVVGDGTTCFPQTL